MLAQRAFAVGLVVALCGCAGVGVHTDYDPEALFSEYGTFAWLPQARRETGDIRLDNPLIHDRVEDSIEAELIAKGYRKLDAGDPSFYVTYHLALETKLDVTTMNRYYGHGPGRPWGVGFPETYTTEYEEGTLAIDVVDAGTRKLVWRGLIQRRVQPTPDPEVTTRRIHSAVAAILKRFPPEGPAEG